MANSINTVTKEEAKAYYNKRFGKLSQALNEEETLRWRAIEAAINAVSKDRDLRIADFGCGRGWLSNKLSEYGQVTGFDISEDAINNAKNSFPSILFYCIDASQPLSTEFFGKFNMVISSEIIEHITNQKEYLENVKFLLSDGGKFILTTPNGHWKDAFYVNERVKWKQPIENWKSPHELKKLISEAGLKQLKQTTFNSEWIFDFQPKIKYGFLSNPMLRKLIKLLGVYKITISWLNKNNRGLNIIINGFK